MSEEHGSRKDVHDTAPSFGRPGNRSESGGKAGAGGSGGYANQMATLQSDEPRRVAAGEVKVVKICKSCMVSQSGGGGFCVKCGAELVPIRSVRDSCLGEVVGGKYKIVEQIGSGGMGEVYLGVNEPLGQRVAVKFLSRKFAADEAIIIRFLNEARSYAKVSHPNAVTLLEYGQHEDGALYLITEYIEGKILSEVIKSGGPMSVEQIVAIATQLCNVLSAAHKEGVIHRDLKPDNIMLIAETRGRYAVKVLDFGIAKILDDDHHNSSQMTETGSIFGTPEFMSPEQARGETTDGRSDLYSIGIILFYVTTGRLPFRGKNKFAILNQQLNDPPPRPSEVRDDVEVPLVLEDIILKCLQKRADDRYQRADDLAVALEEMLADLKGLKSTRTSEKDVKQVSNKPKVVINDLALSNDLAVIPAAMLEDQMSVTLGGVTGEDEGWSDSFAGSSSAHEDWDSQLSGDDSSRTFHGKDAWENEWEGGSDARMPASEGSSMGAKAALLALIAVLLVGGSWFVTDGFRAIPGFAETTQMDDSLSDGVSGLDMESLGGVSRMIDAGDLDAAQRSIESMQTLLVTPEDRAKLEDLIERRQSAENLEKRVRAAIQGGQCDEADRLAGNLASVSLGLKQTLDGGLKNCRRPVTVSPASNPANQQVAPAVARPVDVVPAPVVPAPIIPVVDVAKPIIPVVDVAKPVEVLKPVEVSKPVETNIVPDSAEPAHVGDKFDSQEREAGTKSSKKSSDSDDEPEPQSPRKPESADEVLDDGMILPPRQL